MINVYKEHDKKKTLDLLVTQLGGKTIAQYGSLLKL